MLSDIYTHDDDHCTEDLAGYLARRAESGTKPSSDDLLEYAHGSDCMTVGAWEERDVGKITKNYMTFFPDISFETDESGNKIPVLKTLEDLDVGAFFARHAGIMKDFDSLENPGYYIYSLMAANALSEEATIEILEDFTSHLISRFNSTSVGSITDVIQLIYMFDPMDEVILRKNQWHGMDWVIECSMNATIEKLDCGEEGKEEEATMPGSCVEYCRLVREGLRAQDLLMELFELSTPVLNSLGDFKAPLGDCKWSEDNRGCWREIVNEKGACVTSYTNGTSRNFHYAGGEKKTLFLCACRSRLHERRPGRNRIHFRPFTTQVRMLQ